VAEEDKFPYRFGGEVKQDAGAVRYFNAAGTQNQTAVAEIGCQAAVDLENVGVDRDGL
jgi:hypothetical protein